MNRVIPWLAVFAVTLNVAPPVQADTDPYQLYAHARAVWLSQRYPAFVSYRIAVVVDEKGVLKTNHYRALYDAFQDAVHVDAVSLEEHANPHIPTGVNMSVRPKRNFQTLFSKPVGRPEDAVDFLGVPQLAPNYCFGIAPYIAAAPPDPNDAATRDALVQEIRREHNDPMSAQKSEDLSKTGGLKEIASVATTNRNYVMTYDGVENIGGRDSYHLSLRPVHSPLRLRLREMWIDMQTFATSQLVTQGNFNALGDVPWTVTFANVGGTQYIASETANAPISFGPHTYDHATISFESIAATQPSLPLLRSFTPAKITLEEPADR